VGQISNKLLTLGGLLLLGLFYTEIFRHSGIYFT